MNALAVQPMTNAYSLRELLRGLVSDALLSQVPERLLGGLSMDSRKLSPNSAFFAVPGLKGHGLDHVAQAVANGASVVLWQPDASHAAPPIPGVTFLAVPQLSSLLGQLADRFYQQPSAAMKIAAVTGTNGKTTTAWLIAGAAERCGFSAGYSGTIGYGRITALNTATHTTPDVVSVHRQLAELRDAGATVAGVEVSSHALDQARIDAVRVDTAVFTNLTHDHLDYHGSMSAYGAAKAKLFQIQGLRHRVINADDAFGRELLSASSPALTTAYTCNDIDGGRVLRARSLHLSADGLQLDLAGSFGAALLRSPLLGRFNAENILATLAVLLGWDVPLSRAVNALQTMPAPAGRMELLQAGQQRVVIDYAHTPDALEKTLGVLKEHCTGRIICVFGCGGDRDASKRAPMGAIAARLADLVIVTDDNPRTEDPEQIIAAIKTGAPGYNFMVQRDRATAIEQAIAQAATNDIVLIAGKGHEDYQIIGTDVRHFSDREVVHAVLGGAT